MQENEKKGIIKLIRINLDAWEGYRNAAGNTDDSLLTTFFNKCALDRKGYAENLASALEMTIEEFDTDIKADLHRVWIDLKGARKKFNSKAILQECERGEEYAVETYEEVLKEKAYPASLSSSIRFQKNDIISKYDQIRKLKTNFEDEDDLLNRQTSVP